MTISELTLKTRDEEPVRRFEVFTGAGRRRAWSEEEKARIVAESYSDDMTVCAVARHYGLSPQQLFAWRRLSRKRRQDVVEVAPMFVPAIVGTPNEPAKKKAGRPRSVVSVVRTPPFGFSADRRCLMPNEGLDT